MPADLNAYLRRATPGIADAFWARQGKMPDGVTPLYSATPAAQPAASYWRPSFLNTPPIPYPSNYYGGMGGGRGMGGGGRGGGGFVMPQANAYNPTMFQGAGAYYPGHQAEFQAQQQAALMGIMAGRLQPDTRQPAQMAAAYARDAGRFRGAGQGYNRAAVGGGYGGGYGSAGGIAGDFQRGFEDARQANDARYRDVLEGYDARMAYLQGAGAQEYADINEAYDAQKAAGLQSLTGRGLGNSTLVNTMGMGYDRERSNSIGRLEERLRNQYLDTQKDTLDFMERRTDTYPDLQLLNQIGQLQGQAGGGLPNAYQVSMYAPSSGGGFYPMYSVPNTFGAGSGTWGRIGAPFLRKPSPPSRAQAIRDAMRAMYDPAFAKKRQDDIDAHLFD